MGVLALPEVSDDPFLRAEALQQLQPSFSEYISRRAIKGFQDGPISQHGKELDLYKAEDDPSPVLTPEQSAIQFPELKLNYPIKESAAKLLEQHRVEQLQNQELLSHPSTLLRSVGGWGAEMAGNLLDPENVAFQYIGLGEVRSAKLALSVGKVPARLIEGTIAGAPLMANQAIQQYQTEKLYGGEVSKEDAIKSALWGTLAVAGLHTAFGTVGDIYRYARGRPDPIEVFRATEELKRQLAAEPQLREEILQQAGLPENLLADTQRAIQRGTLAQMDRGEIINAPDRIANLDHVTLEQRAIQDLAKTGEWDGVIHPTDAALSVEEYARKFPEQVTPAKPLTEVPALLSTKEVDAFSKSFEVSKSELKTLSDKSVVEISKLQSELAAERQNLETDIRVSQQAGKSEKDLLKLQDKIEKLGKREALYQELLQRSFERDSVLRQAEFQLNFKTLGRERFKVVEKGLLNGEAIPRETFLQFPELLKKYPERALSSMTRFELEKQRFMDAVDAHKSELLKEELLKLSQDQLVNKPALTSEALVKEVPKLEGDNFRPVSDATSSPGKLDELAKFESDNKQLMADYKGRISEADLAAAEKLSEEITFAKKWGEALKTAANCIINHEGLI